MAWFILARIAFVGAVAYSAFMLRPLGDYPAINLSFGVCLALLSVVFEWQLRNTSVTHMLGAFIGGAVGLLLAKGSCRAVLDRPRRSACRVPAQLHLLVFRISGS